MPTDNDLPPDASQNAAPAQSSTIADKLRALVAGIIADPLNRKGFSAALAQAPQGIASGRALSDKIVSYLPVPQSIRDHVSDLEDLAQDTADSALSNDPMDTMKAQATSIGRGVQQGVTGFNEGLGSTFAAPVDALHTGADYLTSKVGQLFGLPPIDSPQPSQMYNAAFVDPAGPPMTRGQKLMRAGGNAVGQSVPTMFGSLGLATSGVRSGVSLADQAAGGLVDSIEAPAAVSATSPAADVAVAPATDAASAPASSISGVFQKYMPMSSFAARQIGRAVPSSVKSLPANILDTVSPTNLQSGAQNFVDAVNPTNIVNAFNPANLSGAADSTLDMMAQNPALVAKAKAVQAFHSGVKNERALLNQPQQQPPDASGSY